MGASQPEDLAPASVHSQRPLLYPRVPVIADPAICHVFEGDRTPLHVRMGSALLWVLNARIWFMQMFFSPSLPPSQGRPVVEAHRLQAGHTRSPTGVGGCRVQEGGRVNTQSNGLGTAGHPGSPVRDFCTTQPPTPATLQTRSCCRERKVATSYASLDRTALDRCHPSLQSLPAPSLPLTSHHKKINSEKPCKRKMKKCSLWSCYAILTSGRCQGDLMS